MRFITDVNLGRSIEIWLKENGHDVLAIRDVNPRLPDTEILNIAKKEERIVITLDKDFGELVYRSSQSHTGVILLRLENESKAEKVRVLAIILKNYSKDVPNRFCVYQNDRFRIR